MTRRLVLSGAAPAAWKDQADKVFGDWSAGLAPELRQQVRFSPFTCYRDGCVTTATYQNAGSVMQLTSNFTSSQAFHSWRGGKYRSDPEIDSRSGEAVSLWVLFRPDETQR